MCLEDYNIGKALQSFPFNVSVGLAAKQILVANAYRYALLIDTDGAAAVWLGQSPSVAVGNGMIFKTTDQHVQLCISEWGDFVRGDLWVIGAAAGPTQVAITVSQFDQDEFEEMRRKYQ